jgi:hypothetical protein
MRERLPDLRLTREHAEHFGNSTELNGTRQPHLTQQPEHQSLRLMNYNGRAVPLMPQFALGEEATFAGANALVPSSCH